VVETPSRQAVRCAGLDITVHESDTRRRAGHLSRQGSPVLRWAAFEAAQCATRPSSQDHEYYVALKERLGANRAALTIARKLLRRRPGKLTSERALPVHQ
jgi:transposase